MRPRGLEFASMVDILAVTTSLHTPWEEYSQALIRYHAPHWQRVVVDGRRGWTPLGFIQAILDYEVDYVIHIDEDCFVIDSRPVMDLVAEMGRHPALVAAGIPDGGHYYREHNPAALNLFFIVFQMRALRSAWAGRKSWGGLRFEDGYGRDVIEQVPGLAMERVTWDEAEPYYPLFWQLMKSGGRFLYLGNSLRRDRWSTLVLNHRGALMAEHLWYLRQWFSRSTMPGHDCGNRQRYESLRSEIDLTYRADWRFKRCLWTSRLARLARRLLPPHA